MGRKKINSLPLLMSDVEKYEILRIKRADCKNAPYNPRFLTTQKRKKLEANLRRVGMLMPPVWNKRTGNIVGGHQRVSIIDDMLQTDEYEITVAAVDMDEKTEKEQNVFLNNPEAQGDYDQKMLEDMFKVEKIGFEEAGFDLGQIYRMFGESPFIAQPDKLVDLAERIRQAQEAYGGLEKAADDRDDADFYLVFVFKSRAHRARFLAATRLPDNRYHDGELILRTIANPVHLENLRKWDAGEEIIDDPKGEPAEVPAETTAPTTPTGEVAPLQGNILEDHHDEADSTSPKKTRRSKGVAEV